MEKRSLAIIIGVAAFVVISAVLGIIFLSQGGSTDGGGG